MLLKLGRALGVLRPVLPVPHTDARTVGRLDARAEAAREARQPSAG